VAHKKGKLKGVKLIRSTTKDMKFIISIVLTIATANFAYADAAHEAGPGKISYFAPWSPWVDIIIEGHMKDPDLCGAKNIYRIDIANDPGAQYKVSTLLAAKMAGKEVTIALSGCVSGKPKVNGVRLYE